MCSYVVHINTHMHTHAHTDQCTVWCLWRMGVAYWTSTSTTQEHCHAQQYFMKREELEPPKTGWWGIYVLNGHWMCFSFFSFFYSQHNTIHSLQVSRQSDGYERENFQLNSHVTQSVFFRWFFLHRIMLFFSFFFLNWTNNFLNYYYLKPNLAVFQCLHRIELIYDFSTLPYCFF